MTFQPLVIDQRRVNEDQCSIRHLGSVRYVRFMSFYRYAEYGRMRGGRDDLKSLSQGYYP